MKTASSESDELELWLLRHAKSAWNEGVASDFERPLNDRGKRDAPRMGRWMAGQHLVPDYIVASPAKRVRQTVKRVCRALNVNLDQVRWDERIYEADVRDLLAVLRECPASATRVLLVGHDPGLSELLKTLGEFEPSREVKLMPTAALARLRINGSWRDLEPGKGRLMDITRPRGLPSDL
ncbi:SixA phosphatase family protein [Methylohalobius crimeensis]|uniref:SixA phosphatase family protein n=1 Tax=Methylohalobius crimeensis TaxID=244365 RepID=UPI0003B67A51|nr:histidine phosphatase family protein [Methylohalobius crimeensis]